MDSVTLIPLSFSNSVDICSKASANDAAAKTWRESLESEQARSGRRRVKLKSALVSF